MSSSIDSSPTLRCASSRRRSSSGRGRDFRPLAAAAQNSPRHALMRPAGWASLPGQRVQALAAQQPQTTSSCGARSAHLPPALRATVRRAGARPLAAVHPGPP
jgi:hypothetical protein